MIEVKDAFEVAAPVAHVFAALGDVETVIACLPGARVVGPIDERNALAHARVPFGRVSITYRGSVHVTGDDRDTARISFRIRGREVRGDGVVEAIVDVLLRGTGATTQATVKADASITGRAAILRDEVVAQAARTLLRRFGGELSTRMAGVPMANVEGEAHAKEASVPDTPEPTTTTSSPPIVAGEVRLMTDEPVEMDADGAYDTPVVRISRVLEERPWLAPAGLIGVLILVLLLRRRRP